MIVQGTLEDFPKLAPLPVEPEEDEVADDLKVCTKSLELDYSDIEATQSR